MRMIDADILLDEFKKEIAILKDTPAKDDYAKGIMQGYKEAIMHLKAAPTLAPPTEWMSIEDRLPEECADILLCRKILKIPEIGTYRQARFWVYDEIGDVYQVDDITHWMPIPTPYDIDHIHISEPPDGKEGWDKDGKSRRGTKL